MRTVAIVLALAVSLVGVALFVRAVRSIVAVIKLGQPAVGRGDHPGERWKHLLAETLGHTRMLQWSKIGVAHWFVFVAFGALFFTLITAYGQLFDPRFAIPILGHWVVYEWASELIAWAGLISIVFLIIVRVLPAPSRSAVAILRLPDLAGGLRRADHSRHRDLRDLDPGDGVSAAG